MPVRRSQPRMVYPRPPIKEAACEVVFRENQPWDITLPAIIYSKLRESYPSRPSMGTSSFFRSRQDSVPQVVLSTVDARKQVKFGANSLVVSVLAPYNGWEEFSPRIKQALSTFIKVTEPAGIASIRLRYQNEIRIPGKSYTFSEYFTILTSVPKEVPPTFVGFHHNIMTRYKDADETTLQLIFSSVPTDETEALVAGLDIAVSTTKVSETLQVAKIMRLVNELKIRASDVFEALITEKTRALFRDD